MLDPNKPSTTAASTTYYKDLMTEYNQLNKNNTSQKEFMTKQWVDMMIERIVTADEIVKKSGFSTLHETVKSALCTYLVDTEKHGEKRLILKPVPGKEHRSRTVVPLEDTYEVVQKAHLRTNHGTSKEMEAWLRNNNYTLHTICCSIYIKNCDKCGLQQQNGEDSTQTIPKPLPDKKETASRFLYDTCFNHVCSINILNLSDIPDHLYKFLLIYEDRKTNYIQLRPMNTNSETEVSIELIRILMDFGPPECLVVEEGYINMFQNVLTRVKILVAYEITLAYNKTKNKVVETVEKNLLQWIGSHDCRNWGSGCHEVQWNMNNELINGKIPFSQVFGNQYTGCGYKSKFVPQVNDNSDDDDIINLGLVNDYEDENQSANAAEESTETKMSDDEDLASMSGEIKSEIVEPQVDLSNISTSQKLDSFQFDSD